jgi:hypothetical protein
MGAIFDESQWDLSDSGEFCVPSFTFWSVLINSGDWSFDCVMEVAMYSICSLLDFG